MRTIFIVGGCSVFWLLWTVFDHFLVERLVLLSLVYWLSLYMDPNRVFGVAGISGISNGCGKTELDRIDGADGNGDSVASIHHRQFNEACAADVFLYLWCTEYSLHENCPF